MEQSLERRGHEHSRKMLISLSSSLPGTSLFHWRVRGGPGSHGLGFACTQQPPSLFQAWQLWPCHHCSPPRPPPDPAAPGLVPDPCAAPHEPRLKPQSWAHPWAAARRFTLCIWTVHLHYCLTHPHLSQTWGLDSLPSLVPFLQRKHISMCGSLNSQASHFHPPTSTFSRTSCLSLAKYQERAAFSFHDRVDPAGVPVLTGLEIYQSDCKEVSFFGLPLLKRHYFSDNQPEPLKASPRTKCKCSSVNHQQLQGTFRGRTLTTNTQLPQQLHKQGCFPQIPLSYIYGHLLLRLSEVSALWYFTPLLWREREGVANSYGVEIHRGFLKPNIFIYLGTSVRVRRLEKNSASKL